MGFTRRFRALPAILTLLLLGAAVVVVLAGWQTSSARVSATTENPANRWSAGSIELESDLAQQLRLQAFDVWPGIEIEDCVLVSYRGSVADVDVRVFGRLGEGTGLEDFVVATIEVGRGGGGGSCDGFRPDRSVFSGSLTALASSTYESAPAVLAGAQPGDEVSLRISLGVRDDNAAQGLTTDYSLVLEARP